MTVRDIDSLLNQPHRVVSRVSATGRRTFRKFNSGNASDCIGTLKPGCEVYGLTFGKFSLIDLICAILKQTGPAEVDIGTWICAVADSSVLIELLGECEITKFRLMIDHSFARVKPVQLQRIRELFGDDCIRTSSTHAKFIGIKNDNWTLAVRTSMNLNNNPRLETFEISDCPHLFDFMKSVMDIF